QLHAGDGETSARQIARLLLVEPSGVGFQHDTRGSLRGSPHEIREITAQSGFPAGQHDLSGLGALSLRYAPSDRRPAHEVRVLHWPARVAEPTVLVAGLVGDDALNAHSLRHVSAAAAEPSLRRVVALRIAGRFLPGPDEVALSRLNE